MNPSGQNYQIYWVFSVIWVYLAPKYIPIAFLVPAVVTHVHEMFGWWCNSSSSQKSTKITELRQKSPFKLIRTTVLELYFALINHVRDVRHESSLLNLLLICNCQQTHEGSNTKISRAIKMRKSTLRIIEMLKGRTKFSLPWWMQIITSLGCFWEDFERIA